MTADPRQLLTEIGPANPQRVAKLERFAKEALGCEHPWSASQAMAYDVLTLCAALRDALAREDRLRERLLAASGLLRSAYQITKREERVPHSTDWDGFALQLSKELALQHEITGPMYAEQARAALGGTEGP